MVFSVSLCLCVSTIAAADAPVPKFEPQTIDDKIRIGYGVVIGEIDGDGKPDILLADARQIVWYKNPGAAGKAWTKFVMAENLTQRDNVCIAARDINGDGKVEVAVGSNWNPGNTTDPAQSGAVFYLIRPDDPTQKWEAVKVEPHEPTVHRMRWLEVAKNDYRLVVLPLHGNGNRNGAGEGVKVIAYRPSEDKSKPWPREVLSDSMHMTHNMDLIPHRRQPNPVGNEYLVIAGREGLFTRRVPSDDRFKPMAKGKLIESPNGMKPAHEGGAGEVRYGRTGRDGQMYVCVEPMHGNQVVVYVPDTAPDTLGFKRVVLDDTFKQGHALAARDLLKIGGDQIVAGWRMPNAEKRVGIKMYVPLDDAGTKWATHVIDDNKMACEDLAVGDLDGDGRLDLVASGRGTRNVMVYWNRSEVKKD